MIRREEQGPEAGPDEVEEHRMPLLEHLRELRNRVIYGLIFVGVGLILGMVVAKDVIDFTVAPVKQVLPGSGDPNEMDLLYARLTEPLMRLPGWEYLITSQAKGDLVLHGSLEGVWVWLRAAFLFGGLVALPFVAWQAWAFVAPGLYDNEKMLAIPILVSSVALFYAGAAFAYYVVFPLLFEFFTQTGPENVAVMTDINQYLNFVLKLFFAFGVAFEIPIATFLLILSGATTVESLSKKRPYIVLGCFVVGMLLTPPDVISQSLLAIPMYLLYEVGLLFGRLVRKRRAEADAEDQES